MDAAPAGVAGSLPTVGGIDCDLHPAVPNAKALIPYLDEYWRQAAITRGMDRMSFALNSQPANAPVNVRADWRQPGVRPGTDLEALGRDALDAFGTRLAICNPLYGPAVMHSDDMAAAFCGAMNRWLATEWLDREPRLRGSIVVQAANAELAVAEIERAAEDRRFVQVLLLAMNDEPLGRRRYWPIYAAAERLGLPVCIHAGGAYRHAPTATGWGSHYLDDYVAQAGIAESTLLSLVVEGVFAKYPKLTVVFAETGFTWLPACLWRLDKTWRGTRAETPWLDEPPSRIVRRHMRFTLQPVDAPLPGPELARVLDQIDCEEMLLFSTDYPHTQYENGAALPAAFAPLARRILVDNPLATYPRLSADALHFSSPEIGR